MERSVILLVTSRSTTEGAGVRLHRVFGFHEVPRFDPFLMLDDFSSPNPADYLAGFPRHPHRGIETVTYVLKGMVEHRDSIGNHGVIGPGDVQWMTAGRGIIHQEMPRHTRDGLAGFQLWVNLPRQSKMIAPRYQDVKAASIPDVAPAMGAAVRVIAGEVAGAKGPVKDIIAAPCFLDVRIEPGAEFVHTLARDHNAFVYVLEGEASVGDTAIRRGQSALLGAGDLVRVKSAAGARLLLVSGKPLNEPVAWRGPMVMNSEEELDAAFDEYEMGTFVKSSWGQEA